MKKQGMIVQNRHFGVFLFCVLCIADPIFAEDWHQFHGPQRNRISRESDWQAKWDQEGPPELWRQTIGVGFASISVVGNRAYTMGNQDNQDTVWCFDANTGEEIWKYTYPCERFANMHEGGPCGTPTVDAHAVFTVSKEGRMFCLDVATGTKLWEKNLPEEFGVKIPTWHFSVSPLLENEHVILDVGSAIALNKITGDVIWKTKDYGASYSSPVAFTLREKRYLAIFPAFGLVILDAQTGAEIGKYEWKTRYEINAATPIVSGNQFFISSGYGSGGSLLEMSEDGQIKEVWHNRMMRNHMNACVLWNNYLYGFDESNLKCIDFKTGKDQWSESSLGKGSLMLADGKLIILGERGELVIAEASEKEWKPITRKQVLSGRCWTIPVLSHGKIFCRNAAGDLVCLDVRKQ
ncbi:MAG: alcohol dehydrogenase [Candidatus Omnitrophota bacterium]|jgi:outer membrane protein assembly factor BamB|nr:MAG: alcohol dehydrogenase [Candidatus Omnitrophota bacterium]